MSMRKHAERMRADRLPAAGTSAAPSAARGIIAQRAHGEGLPTCHAVGVRRKHMARDLGAVGDPDIPDDVQFCLRLGCPDAHIAAVPRQNRLLRGDHVRVNPGGRGIIGVERNVFRAHDQGHQAQARAHDQPARRARRQFRFEADVQVGHEASSLFFLNAAVPVGVVHEFLPGTLDLEGRAQREGQALAELGLGDAHF